MYATQLANARRPDTVTTAKLNIKSQYINNRITH